MSILSYQTIKRLRIFDPCEERTVHVNTGMTYGLGPAGYDVRLAEDLTLMPGEFALVSIIEKMRLPDDVLATVHDKSTLARMGLTAQTTVAEPGWFGYLTLELSNNHPNHAPYYPHGEDDLSRDVRLRQNSLVLYAGQPIAQIVCHRLDEPTEKPYQGKYQDQPANPVHPIFER